MNLYSTHQSAASASSYGLPISSNVGSNQSHSTLVENYFKSSRVHFIGTWRNWYRKCFPRYAKGCKSTEPNLSASASSTAIIHIDMVADQFYDILHKHCNKVQAVSCDEAFLDVTDVEGVDPEVLASTVRKEIFETTGCTASAGIARNMLMARLATRTAKPDGQCYIPPEKDVKRRLK